MGGGHPIMLGGGHAMMGGRVVVVNGMRGGPRAILMPPHPMMRRAPRKAPRKAPVIPGVRLARRVNSSTSVTKKKRVGKITLYHLTSISAGKAIKKSGKMLRGSKGWFGGGIYFAKSIAICARKSKNGTECVIKAEVNMGTALLIDANTCKTTYTYTKLKKMGCDSVIAKGIPTGDEFVVFDYIQVKILSIKDKHGKDI